MKFDTVFLQRAFFIGLLCVAGISKKFLLLNEELLLSVCVFAFAVFTVVYGGKSIQETLEVRQIGIRKAFQQGILQQQAALQDLRASLVSRSQAPERFAQMQTVFTDAFVDLQHTQERADTITQKLSIGHLAHQCARPQAETDAVLALTTLSSLGADFRQQKQLHAKTMEVALADFRKACTA